MTVDVVKQAAKVPIRGHVGHVDSFRVMGWAEPFDGRWPAVLEIRVDGAIVGRTIADRFREDLKAAGIGDGRVAFEYSFEPPVALFGPARVEVRYLDGDGLSNQTTEITPALIDGATHPVRLDDRIWAASIFAVHPGPEGLVCNSVVNAPEKPPPVSASGAEIVNQHVGVAERLLAEWPGWRHVRSGPYFLSVTLRPTTDEPLAWLRLMPPEQSETSLPLDIPVPLHADWHTLAGSENYRRTSGPSVASQIPSGVQTAAKVDALIRRYGDLTGRADILDWGIGAGRVAVPLKRLFRPDDVLVGVDVDDVNVRWCQEHLVDIPTGLSDLYPPLSFADGSFDVVFGISVMTHLPQAMQTIWLRELRRILRPGGLAILTVLGDYGLVQRRVSSQAFWELRRDGISDSTHDPTIEVTEPGYYRGTFQTRGQVEGTWTREMPIVAYLPMANQMRQDFVVLRKQ